MIKNKLTQIIFRTVYIVLGVIGIIGSLGYFKQSFNSNFYVYYTNLSNYICFGVILFLLIKSIKNFGNEQQKSENLLPKFRFMCLIMILVTCLVYNILLAKENTVAEYFFSLSNLIMHLILPIMFTLDWVLFTEHGKTKWSYPLLSLIMPLAYVAIILFRALILGAEYTGLLYPYFFLNVKELGFGGVCVWLVILIAVFLLLGYAIYALDNLQKIKQKLKKQDKQFGENNDGNK